MACFGRLPWKKLPVYWAAQTLGSLIASACMYGVYAGKCSMKFQTVYLSWHNFQFLIAATRVTFCLKWRQDMIKICRRDRKKLKLALAARDSFPTKCSAQRSEETQPEPGAPEARGQRGQLPPCPQKIAKFFHSPIVLPWNCCCCPRHPALLPAPLTRTLIWLNISRHILACFQ